jgi:hypothetical protein
VRVCLVHRLRDAADHHWQAVKHSGDDDIGSGVGSEAIERLTKIEGAVLHWLDRTWHLIRRFKAWRTAGPVA